MNQRSTVVKQMIDMQKASVDWIINNVIMMWDQSAAFFDGIWFPQEGKKAFRQWVDINKKACDDLKQAADRGYSNLEKAFERTAQEAGRAISRMRVVSSPQGENQEMTGESRG